jgi:voltage-gated potassium channel
MDDGERRQARWAFLARAHRRSEPALVALSVVWIGVVVADLVYGSLPPLLGAVVWIIWGLFILEYGVGLLIAPDRAVYVRARWLTALSLVLPALRIVRLGSALRLVGASRLMRSVGLLRVLTSVNRGLGTLQRLARRRGIGYVLAATAIVVTVGAAGMAYFEAPTALGGDAGRGALSNYESALWWTAYAMTSGVPSQPQTTEGRLLGWLLTVYGLAVFGYVTAILASHFVERDQAARATDPAGVAATSRPPESSGTGAPDRSA